MKIGGKCYTSDFKFLKTLYEFQYWIIPCLESNFQSQYRVYCTKFNDVDKEELFDMTRIHPKYRPLLNFTLKTKLSISYQTL